MYKTFLFVIIVCFSFISRGQVAPSDTSLKKEGFPEEKTALTVNTTLLLAGESLLYKAYNHFTFNNDKSDLSKLVYVSLRTKEDSIVFNHKLKLKQSTATGTFFIPATLNSGVYRLIAYTNSSLNNEKNGLSEKQIYIINPYIKSIENDGQKAGKDSVQIKFRNDFLPNANKSSDKELSLQTNKQSYKTRKKATITVNSNVLADGDYVLSVRKLDPVQIVDDRNTVTKLKQKNTVFRIPELRGELITGKVISTSGNKSVSNKNVSLTIPGVNYIFKNAVTNKNGRFYFSITQPYYTEDCIIQINEPNKVDYKIVLDKNELRPQLQEEGVVITMDPKIKDWLQNRSIQSQIENAYFSSKENKIIDERNNSRWYDTIGTNYVLDSYTRFNTVEETFVEVIKNASIKKKGNEYTFEVFDRAATDVSGLYKSLDVLVLMDGFLIQNNSEVVNYDANKIKSISILNEAYRFGPKIYSDVIVIETKKGDFRPIVHDGYMKEFKLTAPLSAKEYESVNILKEPSKRIPDYRVQLLWEPDVTFTENKIIKTFYTSNVKGTFEVSLEGFSEKGEPVSIQKTFTVE